MGWNGSDARKGDGATACPPRAAKAPARSRGIAAGLAVATLAAGFMLWMLWTPGGSGPDAEVEEAVHKPARGLEAVVPAGSGAPEVPAEAPKTEEAKPAILGKTPTGEAYVAMTAQTNNDGVVVARYQLEDGSWSRVVTLQSKESRIFDTALDTHLALIAATPLNQPLPPMPPIPDVEKAFAEAITHPVIPRATDSEEVKRLKQSVVDMRLQIADLMHEGYTVGQILSENESLRSKNIEFRREMQKELNKIYRTEGPNAAAQYMKDANARLEKVGVVPLSMPGGGNTMKRRYDNEQ